MTERKRRWESAPIIISPATKEVEERICAWIAAIVMFLGDYDEQDSL